MNEKYDDKIDALYKLGAKYISRDAKGLGIGFVVGWEEKPIYNNGVYNPCSGGRILISFWNDVLPHVKAGELISLEQGTRRIINVGY